MRALLQYQSLMYRACLLFLFPVLFVISYCGSLYILSQDTVSGCFAFSGLFLFAVSLLDGFFMYRIHRNHMDEILLLKCGNAVKYHFSKEVFLVLIALLYTILILLYPYSLLSFGTVIVGRRTVGEVIAVFFIHLLIALCGYEIGSLFQPHMIGSHLPAVPLFLMMVLGIFARQVLPEIPVIKYLLWLFPPVAKLLRLMYIGESFAGAEIGHTAFQLILYTLLAFAGKVFLLNRRKWTVCE